MTGSIQSLIEQYGLIAVFVGCFFEGETAAILGGFFAHQGVFAPWQMFLVSSSGAFVGDTAFFMLGRRFANHRYVLSLRAKPGFSHAFKLVQTHPNIFVFSNRYLYGLRLAGGVAAGLSTIPVSRFLVINALSALVWAALFCGLGYFFGLGAETPLGTTLHKHRRLLVALIIAVVATVVVVAVTHHFVVKRRRKAAGEARKT